MDGSYILADPAQVAGSSDPAQVAGSANKSAPTPSSYSLRKQSKGGAWWIL